MIVKSFKKRYKPQRITNVCGDGHIVKLCPNQSFTLLLNNPSEYDMKGCEWHIQLNSEYLKLVPMKDKAPGAYAAEIMQLHNLSQWAASNRTFLGNLFVSFCRRTETIAEYEPWGSVAVFLDPDPDCINKQTVTVVRPSDQIIRVDRDEILEVVIPDVPQLLWRPYTFPLAADGKFYLELINSEYIDEGVASVTNRGYTSRHWTTPEQSAKVGEHHFWFRWSDRSRVEASSTEVGVHPGSRLAFMGKNYKKEVEKELRLRVYLSNKRSKKIELPTLETKNTLVETDLTKRIIYEDRRLLVNPKELEEITFFGPLDMFTVELMVPKGKVTGKWEPTIKPVTLEADGHTVYAERIMVMSKEQYEIDGNTFQKFQLIPRNVRETADELNLGEVIFNIPGGLNVSPRRITCRLKKQVIKDTRSLIPYNHKASASATATATSNSYALGACYTPNRHQYGVYHNEGKKKKELDYAEVQIQDVSLDLRLDIGETTLKSHFNHYSSNNYTPPKDTVSKKKSNTQSDGATESEISSLVKKSTSKTENTDAITKKIPSLKRDGAIALEDDSVLSLKDGVALQVYLPVDMATSHIWEYKVARRNENCSIKLATPWLHSVPNVGVLQNFNIKVDSKCAPGRHFAGTLVFSRRKKDTNESEIITVFVYVEGRMNVEATDNYGQPFRMIHNEKQNCITLVDPLGSTPHHVPIREGQQLELLMQTKTGGYFNFAAKMLLGKCSVVSNDDWKLYDYSRFQRILFRFEGNPIEGEINLYSRDENKKVGQVSVTSSLLQGMYPVEDDYCTIEFKGDSEVLKNPLDGDNFYLNPHAFSSIRFSKPDKHLATHLAGTSNPYEMKFDTKPLSYLVDSLDWVDQINPWNSFCGMSCTGGEPWDSTSYSLNPIQDSQQRFQELINAIEIKAGERMPVVDIGTIECTYKVSDVFRMSTKIGIGVKNKSYLNTFYGEKPEPRYDLTNPSDTSSFDIYNGKALRIKLFPKTKSIERAETKVFWTLMSTPAWLFPIGSEEESNGDQLFYFYCHLPNTKKSRRGTLKFDCGNLIKRLTVAGHG